jgi:tRNA-splicing ligase RtcB
MNTKDFLRLGVPLGEATRRAADFVAQFILGGGDKSRLHEEVAAIVANLSAFVEDPLRGDFAKTLISTPHPGPLPGRGGEEEVGVRRVPVKYRQWGEHLEHDAVMQMEKACLLPVSVAGALMPDAHVGCYFLNGLSGVS